MALNEFEGTVMLVSHDRALLRAVCDEFWLVGRGEIKPFDGDLDDYQRYLLDTSDIQIRDGLIQRYEFTYEVSHKILKRYLETTSASLEIYDSMPFSDLIRSGNEQSLLLGNWNQWQVYCEMRIKSSRADDEELRAA